MRIKILGAESLGVRGLACVVTLAHRRIVIDPGVALGYWRHGLLPHPAQVAVGEEIRRQIRAALREATDVVFSHYHGDHNPVAGSKPLSTPSRRGCGLLAGTATLGQRDAGSLR